MHTVVVGDIHGQHEVVSKILDLNMPTVFVGDFLDSYTRSPEDQYLALSKALAAAEERENVDVLFGNHELSYLYPEMLCSGYNLRTQTYVNLIKPQMLRLMATHVEREGFLISHAGVSQGMLDSHNKTLKEYLDEGKYHQIGRARGGRDHVGGLHWCDWNMEFDPVPGVPQIVGHTRGAGVREKEGSYCIDCLEDTDRNVLFIKDGVAESTPLEDL